MSDDVIYHGVYRETGGCLVLTETPEGEVTGMVAHIPYHSPDGMGWGYGGSGPADCALSLLIAALGEAARRPECNGTRYTVIDTDADPNAEGVDDAIRHAVHGYRFTGSTVAEPGPSPRRGRC